MELQSLMEIKLASSGRGYFCQQLLRNMFPIKVILQFEVQWVWSSYGCLIVCDSEFYKHTFKFKRDFFWPSKWHVFLFSRQLCRCSSNLSSVISHNVVVNGKNLSQSIYFCTNKSGGNADWHTFRYKTLVVLGITLMLAVIVTTRVIMKRRRT